MFVLDDIVNDILVGAACIHYRLQAKWLALEARIDYSMKSRIVKEDYNGLIQTCNLCCSEIVSAGPTVFVGWNLVLKWY